MSFVAALVGQSRPGLGQPDNQLFCSWPVTSQQLPNVSLVLFSHLASPANSWCLLHKVPREGTDTGEPAVEVRSRMRKRSMAPQEKSIKPSPAWIYDRGRGKPKSPRTSQLSLTNHTSLNFLWGLFQSSWSAPLCWGDEKRDFHEWLTCRWVSSGANFARCV